LIGAGSDRKGLLRGAVAPTAAVGGGCGGLAALDGGKRVGEHRWRPRKLATGSFGREEGWKRELRGRPTSGDANGGHGKRRSRERERKRRGGSGSMERVRERSVLACERDKDGMGGDARRERARVAFVANLTTATTHERESREHVA